MIARGPIHVGTALGALVAALAVAGCGGGASDYANKPRPPERITVTAAISKGRIIVSPARFGAGPVTLVVANESPRSQELILETNEIGASQNGFRQQTGPINPQGTVSLNADMRKGTYVLRARSRAIRPAQIIVGPPRPSAQDKLLQP
jgi:hypothetical protein